MAEDQALNAYRRWRDEHGLERYRMSVTLAQVLRRLMGV